MVMENTIIKKKNVLTFIIVLLIMVLICFMFVSSYEIKEIGDEKKDDYHTYIYKDKEYEFNSSVVSILMLGIDKTEEVDDLGQADAIELLLLDREKKKIKMVTIPRDTMTDIRVFDATGNDLGWFSHHLNLAYAFASNPETGCMYTSQAVSRMFNNIPISHYTSFELTSLKDVHEIVGDLKVKIPNDSLMFMNETWKEGIVLKIDSSNVETYLRARDINEDFSNEERIERQKVYLLEYFNTMKKMLETDFDNTVTKMYNISNSIVTNISLSDMESFAQMILEYDFDPNEDFITIDGKNVVGELHDEFIVYEKGLEELMIRLFYMLED